MSPAVTDPADPALTSLAHILGDGTLSLAERPRLALLRARSGDGLAALPRAGLVCEQSFKPDHDRLAALGYQPTPRIDETAAAGTFDAAICLLTKHKAENLANIARAWTLLRPAGLLIGAGAKDSGAGSIERLTAAALAPVQTRSKAHCRVFWAVRDAAPLPAQPAAWLAAGALQPVAQTGYQARPGLFGWDKIDQGSQLLADHLPADLAGRVADLGAGWGYLADQIVQRCPRVTGLDLYEAEALALDAARANLAGRAAVTEGRVRFHWRDVTAGPLGGPFDAVVMNPPFHSGKAADSSLGRAFIAAAVAALRRGGRLLLVANRHLPYEAELTARCKTWRPVAEAAGFKVLEGQV